MHDQRKGNIDPKGPKQRNCHKQLPTHNLHTDDLENINNTNKGWDLLLANKLQAFPWGAQWIPQRILRHSKVTLHKSTHPKREQDQTGKNLPMAWIHYIKAYDMVPQSLIINCLKMYKISHEVINFIEETRVELTAGGRNLAEAKIQRVLFKVMHYHRYYS